MSLFYMQNYFTLINIASPITWVIIFSFVLISRHQYLIAFFERFTKIFAVMVPYFNVHVHLIVLLGFFISISTNSFHIFAVVCVVVGMAGCLLFLILLRKYFYQLGNTRISWKLFFFLGKNWRLGKCSLIGSNFQPRSIKYKRVTKCKSSN